VLEFEHAEHETGQQIEPFISNPTGQLVIHDIPESTLGAVQDKHLVGRSIQV